MALSTEEVWTALREELLGFFRRRVPDEHAAEDLLQETFIRVHDGLRGLVHEDRLVPWVYRVARNVLADQRRSESRAESVETEEQVDVPTREENFNPEVSRWLRSMLAGLPPDQRAAVELAEVEGLAQNEVAQRLGLSHSGAKSRVQRGRRRLEKLLRDCCHLDFDRRGNVVDYARRGSCQDCCPGARPPPRGFPFG